MPPLLSLRYITLSALGMVAPVIIFPPIGPALFPFCVSADRSVHLLPFPLSGFPSPSVPSRHFFLFAITAPSAGRSVHLLSFPLSGISAPSCHFFLFAITAPSPLARMTPLIPHWHRKTVTSTSTLFSLSRRSHCSLCRYPLSLTPLASFTGWFISRHRIFPFSVDFNN